MLITFPRQQWLHERASMLRYPYVSVLLLTANFIGAYCY